MVEKNKENGSVSDMNFLLKRGHHNLGLNIGFYRGAKKGEKMKIFQLCFCKKHKNLDNTMITKVFHHNSYPKRDLNPHSREAKGF